MSTFKLLQQKVINLANVEENIAKQKVESSGLKRETTTLVTFTKPRDRDTTLTEHHQSLMI